MKPETAALREFTRATKAMLSAKKWGPSYVWWTQIAQSVMAAGYGDKAREIFKRLSEQPST